MKKILISLLSLSLVISNSFSEKIENIPFGFAKNVILMIPDGMSVEGVTLTRWLYNNGEPLALDEIASGMVRTHNSDTIIADSAPAGTAMATGYKTQDKLIGIKPAKSILYGAMKSGEQEAYAPIANVLEMAKLQGKSTGLVSTSEVMHATPAAFSAHSKHRKNYSDLGEQQVYQEINVVFGGGYSYLTKEKRDDKEDMIQILKENGNKVVRTKNELFKLTRNNDKVWGLFAEESLPYDIDRKKEEPSLAELTEKAIEILSNNKNGFFLMVEGAKVDWAAHSNSTIALTSDIKSFDNAVKSAINFAKTNKDTLVIVASDHGNGGITIGNRNTSKNYPELSLESFTTQLKKSKASESFVSEEIFKNKAMSRQILKDRLGLEITDDESKSIQETKDTTELTNLVSSIVNEKSNIGWTSGGHTGGDVILYVYASDQNNRLTGVVQNSDIARYIEKAFDGSLEKTTQELFIPSSKVKELGIDVIIDNTDKNNPKFLLTKGDKTYTFFENKNYFEFNNKKIKFNGVVVYNDIEVYFPKKALDLLK